MDGSKPTLSNMQLFGVFLKAGLAFGGGLGILAVLERELVHEKKAVSKEEFLAIYGLGRIVPSGTMTALAVAYGYRFGKVPGTVFALAGLVMPAFVITILLTAAYGLLRASDIFSYLEVSVLPAALGLIVVAALSLGSNLIRPSIGTALAVLAFAGTAVLRFDPPLVLLAGGIAGAIFIKEGRSTKA